MLSFWRKKYEKIFMTAYFSLKLAFCTRIDHPRLKIKFGLRKSSDKNRQREHFRIKIKVILKR